MEQIWIDWAVAAILGMVVGALRVPAHPLTRWHALQTPSALLFLILSISESLMALYILRHFRLIASHIDDPSLSRGIEIMLAGLGAPLVLSWNIANKSVTLSIGKILGPFFSTADGGMRRHVEEKTYEIVESIMADVSFAQSHVDLPELCLKAVRASDEQGEAIAHAVALIRASQASDYAKSISMGLILIDLVGERLLKACAARYQKKQAGTSGEHRAVAAPPPARKRGEK